MLAGTGGVGADSAGPKRSRLSPAPAMAAAAAIAAPGAVAVGGRGGVALGAYAGHPGGLGGGQAGGGKGNGAPAQLLGIPTEEEIKAALRGGPMPAKALVNIFKPRLVSAGDCWQGGGTSVLYGGELERGICGPGFVFCLRIEAAG